MRTGNEIRKTRWSAIWALALACALSAAASASQDSTADASSNKPASAKKTTTTASAGNSKSSPAASSGSSKTPSKKNSTSTRKHPSRKKSVRARGQQKIDSERAQAIQEALIRAHYLNGEATGTWNQASEEAMRRYQADNGWQSKTVPDSRALIKLGLGPSKDHLLNPESAMTTAPDAPKTRPIPSSSHGAPARSDPPAPVVPPSTPAQSDSSSPQ